MQNHTFLNSGWFKPAFLVIFSEKVHFNILQGVVSLKVTFSSSSRNVCLSHRYSNVVFFFLFQNSLDSIFGSTVCMRLIFVHSIKG